MSETLLHIDWSANDIPALSQSWSNIARGSFLAHSPAVAQDKKWLVHVGPSIIKTNERARVDVAGTVIPSAGIGMKDRLAAAIEVGRFVMPNLAIAVTAGLPVRQTIVGTGTIAPYGRLGQITYGPVAASVQWHPLRSAPVRPYVGAGVAYLHVFDNDGASLQDFHVSDDVGPVLQGGVELPVRPGWGLFVDAKKAFLRTRATGSLGGAPVGARIKMDSLVLHAGFAVRF